MTKRWSSGLVLVALLLGSGSASAFCRSTTCNPANPDAKCKKDANLCVTSGHLLSWATSCVSFDAQADGSPKLGIDADTLTQVTERAFAPWLKASCGTGNPPLEVGTFGPVECAESKFKKEYRNANIVMFRDDEWPYPGSIDAFAMTVVNYVVETGQIVDADIEINSADFPIVTDGSAAGPDLQSILTHEVGHFLGLSHATPSDQTATMRAGWDGVGIDLRTLTADDEAGICAIYPPNRSAPRNCTPTNGLGDGCYEPADPKDSGGGCSLTRERTTSTVWLVLLLTALGGLRLRRRR
jgi:hypothetical protein